MFLYKLFLVYAKYTPSVYDPKADYIKEELIKNIGFIEHHNQHIYGPSFGEMSMMTINLYHPNFLEEKNQRIKVTNLIDQHHPTILALQGISKNQEQLFNAVFSPHYKVIGSNYINIDLKSRKREYRPIYYDSNEVELIKEGEFSPINFANHSYATFGIFRMKVDLKTMFIVVNIDLYSGDSEFIETQLYNILKHISESPYSKLPIFFLGMINEQTQNVKDLIKNSLHNVILKDKNNIPLSKTTFHHNGILDDGKQRDFILLRDINNTYIVNYARILSKFEKKDILHYPIYAIFQRKLTQQNKH